MSSFGFLLVVIALAFLWFALIRPQKRRQRAQTEMWDTLEPGDEVVTAGGIYGEITGFAGDDLLVRIAPELEVRVARRAIGGIVPQEQEDEEPAAEDSAGESESYSEDPR